MSGLVLESSGGSPESGSAIIAAYQENCDYDLEPSVAKCKLFIAAARKLLANPIGMQRGGSANHGMQFNWNNVQNELKKAEQWLSANTVATSATGRNQAQMRLVNLQGVRE